MLGRQRVSELTVVLARLRDEAFARAAFVVDEDGDILAYDADSQTGLDELGRTSVTQLGGAEGLARQLDTPDFGVVFHDAVGQDVWVSVLNDGYILGILFDQGRTSLGNVRLRASAFRAHLLQAISDEGVHS